MRGRKLRISMMQISWCAWWCWWWCSQRSTLIVCRSYVQCFDDKDDRATIWCWCEHDCVDDEDHKWLRRTCFLTKEIERQSEKEREWKRERFFVFALLMMKMFFHHDFIVFSSVLLRFCLSELPIIILIPFWGPKKKHVFSGKIEIFDRVVLTF